MWTFGVVTDIEVLARMQRYNNGAICYKCNTKLVVGDKFFQKKVGKSQRTRVYHESCWGKMNY